MSSRDSGPEQVLQRSQASQAIASRFVSARLEGRALAHFPGSMPDDLSCAYEIQDRAIALWPTPVAGWKVGYIAAERRDGSGDERLVGPIFRDAVVPAGATSVPFEVFDGGFSAVEAEYVLRLETDVPLDQQVWSPDEAARLPTTLHMGVEIASSPLAMINLLGPTVVVSDFGNNNGLIVGAEIAHWRDIQETSLTCSTWIDGKRLGTGGATSLPGGLLAAFAFALTRLAQRGRWLKAGDLIATGNATGIHDIALGQAARIVFDGLGEIACHAVKATPQSIVEDPSA